MHLRLTAGAASSAPSVPNAHARTLEALAILLQTSCFSDVWRGIFTACRGWRDAVLVTAPRARLSFDARLEQTQSAWLQQFTAVRQALQTRGKLPTTVHITTGEQNSSSSEAACESLLTALRGHASSVDELVLAPAGKLHALEQLKHTLKEILLRLLTPTSVFTHLTTFTIPGLFSMDSELVALILNHAPQLKQLSL